MISVRPACRLSVFTTMMQSLTFVIYSVQENRIIEVGATYGQNVLCVIGRVT